MNTVKQDYKQRQKNQLWHRDCCGVFLHRECCMYVCIIIIISHAVSAEH